VTAARTVPDRPPRNAAVAAPNGSGRGAGADGDADTDADTDADAGAAAAWCGTPPLAAAGALLAG